MYGSTNALSTRGMHIAHLCTRAYRQHGMCKLPTPQAPRVHVQVSDSHTPLKQTHTVGRCVHAPPSHPPTYHTFHHPGVHMPIQLQAMAWGKDLGGWGGPRLPCMVNAESL